jgi:hypothetical protein|tara:strand:+ start:7290 stop:7526 length:237 start_codon:yes stop_codon:yes gene_type:complete
MIHIAIFFSPPVDPKAAEAPWSLYQLMRASIQRVSPKAAGNAVKTPKSFPKAFNLLFSYIPEIRSGFGRLLFFSFIFK